MRIFIDQKNTLQTFGDVEIEEITVENRLNDTSNN